MSVKNHVRNNKLIKFVIIMPDEVIQIAFFFHRYKRLLKYLGTL